MIGNFIADSVRSAQFELYSPRVIEGIRLHHKIDEFTDSHPVVEESKALIRPVHEKYSGVVMDIFYDHFLAARYQEYFPESLSEFTRRAYHLLESRQADLSPGARHMLPYMIRGNWLENYARLAGMEKVFNGMGRRATFDNNMNSAVEQLKKHYSVLEGHFKIYFPELQDYVNDEIQKIQAE